MNWIAGLIEGVGRVVLAIFYREKVLRTKVTVEKSPDFRPVGVQRDIDDALGLRGELGECSSDRDSSCNTREAPTDSRES